MVLKILALLCVFISTTATGQVETLRESLGRLEEVLRMRMEEGIIKAQDVVPSLVVSVNPYYEESRSGFASTALSSLTRVFENSGVRVCEACMSPQTFSNGSRLEQRSGTLSLEEIKALDARLRGDTPEARTAIWLDETREGVSIRIVSLQTARVIYADNITPNLVWAERSTRAFDESKDLHRRMRGESLTHSFVDFSVYPFTSFYLGIDWTEQWGSQNENLSGVTFSIISPIWGMGASYARAFPEMWNTLLGGKILLSIPGALISGATGRSLPGFADPLLTAMGFARIPLPMNDANYGGFVFISTAGKFGIGISLLNVSLLPVIP